MRDATSVATVVGARLSLKPYGKGSFMAIDIGISEEDRKSIVDGLSRLLSDTYVLYLKTHNFHWNVTGPSFRTLHLMFEEQYNELALAVDSIAERIRALGFPAPGSYAFYARHSSIKEEEGVPPADEMIRQLVQGRRPWYALRAAFSLWWTRSVTSRPPTC